MQDWDRVYGITKVANRFLGFGELAEAYGHVWAMKIREGGWRDEVTFWPVFQLYLQRQIGRFVGCKKPSIITLQAPLWVIDGKPWRAVCATCHSNCLLF